jgi:hypothetical protein
MYTTQRWPATAPAVAAPSSHPQRSGVHQTAPWGAKELQAAKVFAQALLSPSKGPELAAVFPSFLYPPGGFSILKDKRREQLAKLIEGLITHLPTGTIITSIKQPVAPADAHILKLEPRNGLPLALKIHPIFKKNDILNLLTELNLKYQTVLDESGCCPPTLATAAYRTLDGKRPWLRACSYPFVEGTPIGDYSEREAAHFNEPIQRRIISPLEALGFEINTRWINGTAEENAAENTVAHPNGTLWLTDRDVLMPISFFQHRHKVILSDTGGSTKELTITTWPNPQNDEGFNCVVTEKDTSKPHEAPRTWFELR